MIAGFKRVLNFREVGLKQNLKRAIPKIKPALTIIVKAGFLYLVGMRGFEPPAPASRTLCSTRLSHIPIITCLFAQ